MNGLAGVLFGLATAAAWGAGDFCGGLVSRRSRAIHAALLVEGLGLVILLLAAPVMKEPALPLEDWLWCAGAGCIGSLGLAALYAALGRGQITLSAPVSSVTAAAIPVLLGLFLEGRPSALTLVGLMLALVSVLLVSLPSGEGGQMRISLQTIRLPVLSGLGLGAYFVLMHQGSAQGVLWPMIASRLGGTLILMISLLWTRPLDLPPRDIWPLALLNAVADLGGNAFYILAGQQSRMDIAAVLGSLYSGVTALLAWVILKEKFKPGQGLGILLALVAIGLLIG